MILTAASLAGIRTGAREAECQVPVQCLNIPPSLERCNLE